MPPDEELSKLKYWYDALQRLTLVSSGTTSLPDRAKMLSTIEEVERDIGSYITASVADALANAILCYTAWYVRGVERKNFLQRAVRYYRLSGNEGALGVLLVEEAQVRDLETAIPLLEKRFVNAKCYDPVLCSYVEALYKDGQYMRAYEAGVHLQRLAEATQKHGDVQMSALPAAPMQIAAKALRAEARRLKKAGQHNEAVTILKQLQGTGLATANDVKQLERMKD